MCEISELYVWYLHVRIILNFYGPLYTSQAVEPIQKIHKILFLAYVLSSYSYTGVRYNQRYLKTNNLLVSISVMTSFMPFWTILQSTMQHASDR